MTDKNEKISIALAVYNGEKYLPELLASLEKQTLKPDEIVVVDDCSRDNSLSIIHDFPLSFNKRVFRNETNQGPVYTFKKSAELSSGNFIAFCDQDDIWLPGKIEQSFNKIKELSNDKPAVVFSDLSVIDENGKLVQKSFWKQMDINPVKFSLKDILFDNIITGCTAIVNKSMVDELIKMPADIMMHDHWIALIAYSFGSYAFVDKPTVLYRSHQHNVTNKIKPSTANIFLNDYKNKEQYLKDNIEQAKKFKDLYAGRLKKNEVNILEKFISLQNKNFLVKRTAKFTRRISRKLK